MHIRTVRVGRAFAHYAQSGSERVRAAALAVVLRDDLKNRFYLGYFVWQGIEYKGVHEPLIPMQLFQQVQEVFSGRNKRKHRKHDFAFAELLKCAHDSCTVTAELQKGKYVYYRCSHGRGKCSLPYMREPEVHAFFIAVIKITILCVEDHRTGVMQLRACPMPTIAA